MAKRAPEGSKAIRLADEIGVKRHAHHRRRAFGGLDHLVELGDTPFEPSLTGFAEGGRIVVFDNGQAFGFETETRGSGAASAADGAILAPMPGKVIAVDVKEGDKVTAGQRLMVLEAMKMEHAMTAPFDGTITELNASEGGQVQVEAVLAVVEPEA